MPDRVDRELLSGLAGVVVGPSVGHWYAGKIVTPGLVLRALAVTGMGARLMYCDCSDSDRMDVFLVAGVVWAAGTIYDLATLEGRVSARNARELAIVPVAASDRIGVAISGTW